MYCGPSTASEVFLISTTQLYKYLSVIFLFSLVSDEPDVFLPKYSQTAILHAAHFRWVVKGYFTGYSLFLPTPPIALSIVSMGIYVTSQNGGDKASTWQREPPGYENMSISSPNIRSLYRLKPGLLWPFQHQVAVRGADRRSTS